MIETNQKEIKCLLKQVNRNGIGNLIWHMEQNGFFKAPCSGQYHLCKDGGLAEHSLNVYKHVKALNDALGAGLPEETLVICSILHDLGKMGDYGKDNYVPNMVCSKKKIDGGYPMVQSESKPFVTNPGLLYIPHEVRSVSIARKFIDLTEDEEFAILYHNGLYGDFKYAISGKETPLYLLLHFADMWASRVSEKELT